eukprot:765116-Hanusia_phi.AAC.1
MAMPGLGGRMRMRQLWGWTNRRKQLDGSNSMLDSLRAGSMLISQARSKTISCGAARFDKIVQRDRMQSYKMASNRMGQGNWTCANTGSNKMGCETQGHAFMSTSSHAWPRNAQMNPGSMVIFTRSDSSKAEREIALVKGPARGGKFILLETDAGGAQIAVRRSNVKISLPDPPEGSWSVDSVKTLREEAQSLCDSVQQDHLKQLWEDMRVENEERVVELGDLADNLFKDKSACSMFAAYSTAARFRSLFTPLNNGLVLVHSEEKEEHDLTKRTESLPCLEKLISKISAHLESQRREGMSGSQMKVEEDEEELLVHLEQYAMGLRTLEGLPKLMQVLVYQRVLKSETTSDPRLVAADLLFGIRYWIPGENIHLKRYLKLFYVSSALEAKAELAAANPAADVLEGLRKRMGSVAFAVDDSAENIDIDDAVGLQYEEDGEWLMVHVADPARLCLQDTELDKLAQERASTVYLPEMRIPMLPMSLTRSSSLEEERDNDGLTFSVRLSHSGDIEEYKIVPSRVVNVRKTTYSQVDEMLTWRPEEMLEGEGGRGDADKVKSSFILQRLMSLAKRRMSFRMLNGAVPTEIPKAQVRVWDEEVNGEKRKEVKVEPSTQTPARMMIAGTNKRGGGRFRMIPHSIIAEFMLLAGEVAARFAQERRVPFVYRTQVRLSPSASPSRHSLWPLTVRSSSLFSRFRTFLISIGCGTKLAGNASR